MLRHLCPLALALLCTCRTVGAPVPATDERPLPELPDVFGPFGWATTVDWVRARFPDARLTVYPPEDGFTDAVSGRPLTRVGFEAWIEHAAPFGLVELEVAGFEGRAPAALVVSRLDHPETACNLEGMPDEARAACEERLHRERRALYDRLSERLVALYGPGTLACLDADVDVCEPTAPIDPEQSERCWTPPGFAKLCLAIGRRPDAHTGMLVRLTAIRDERLPF